MGSARWDPTMYAATASVRSNQTREQVFTQREIVNKFDPKSKKLYAIAAKDIKNNTDMSIDYKSFTTADSRLVPRIISVLIQNGNKEKDISIEMEHAKFDFLDRNIRFPFSIPKGYKYQEFDKN